MTMISTQTKSHKLFTIEAVTNFVSDLVLVRRQRAALKSLSLSQLDDMGVSCKQAESEANRPFWDVPVFWRVKSY